MRAVLTERYHSIEKGLSLPLPRKAFGRTVLADITSLLPRYIALYGRDAFTDNVLAVLRSYLEFNEAMGVSRNEIPYIHQIEDLTHAGAARGNGGSRRVSSSSVREATDGVGLDFFTTRHSVRQFSKASVSIAEIEWAAYAARQAPAVCNRQFGRLHVFLLRKDIEQILNIQGGARGFIDEIRGLAIVTTTLTSYWGAGQRNQGWVDGGLFAMSFILGLHAQGIGSIALNWSKDQSVDRRLRGVVDLAVDENVIMIVGFGKLRDQYVVAHSARPPLEATLVIHDSRTPSGPRLV